MPQDMRYACVRALASPLASVLRNLELSHDFILFVKAALSRMPLYFWRLPCRRPSAPSAVPRRMASWCLARTGVVRDYLNQHQTLPLIDACANILNDSHQQFPDSQPRRISKRDLKAVKDGHPGGSGFNSLGLCMRGYGSSIARCYDDDMR